MPERMMQTDDPAAIPRMPTAAEARQGPASLPDDGTVRQIAGAVSALAGRMDRLDERVAAGQRPKVTTADRIKALEQAREYVADLMTKPASEAERVSNEIAVARYLTGE
jgi:hypothetical protein